VKVKNGSVLVKYQSSATLKVVVQKGNERRRYSLDGNGKYHKIPLQLGNGLYTISVIEKSDDETYYFVLPKKQR